MIDYFIQAGVAESADAPDLESGIEKMWRFKSSRPHHMSDIKKYSRN